MAVVWNHFFAASGMGGPPPCGHSPAFYGKKTRSARRTFTPWTCRGSGRLVHYHRYPMLDTVFMPLSVAELDRRLRTVDPAVVLVPPRLLRRVIKHDRKLPGIGLQVPHRKCYVIGRDALFAIVGKADPDVGPDRDLPTMVVLLPRPDPDWLRDHPPERVLVKYWRLLFHSAIHRAIDASGLTPKEIQARIREIGEAAFDEIRAVLRQEQFLLPPADDAMVYEEFAGLYSGFG